MNKETQKEYKITKTKDKIEVKGDGVAEKSKEVEIDFLGKMVKPHKKKSAKVTEKDLPVLMEDAKILYNLCFTQNHFYPGAYAMHHSQINNKKPLDFFVTAMKEIIINPVIVNHTKVKVERIEGCFSFPKNPPYNVERYHKVTVEYQTLDSSGKLSEIKTEKASGQRAQVFQHEIGHGQGELIYNI